jgi:hypothetical protein
VRDLSVQDPRPTARAVLVPSQLTTCCERVELLVDRRGDLPR